MGFNKRHINKDRILSVYKNSGAKGVADLYNADAIITPPNSSVCNYVQKIMSSDNTTKQKRHLIEIYIYQLLEGLYEYK